MSTPHKCIICNITSNITCNSYIVIMLLPALLYLHKYIKYYIYCLNLNTNQI